MKKILIIAAGVLCSVAVYVGVNSYSNSIQTDLMTQNIEALTQGENPMDQLVWCVNASSSTNWTCTPNGPSACPEP